MNLYPFLLVVAVFLVSACGKTDPIAPATYTCADGLAQAGDQHPDADDLNALLDKQLPHFVGVQVALTDAQGNRWTGARGMADIQAGVDLQTCHRIPIASISKTITAAVILQQFDDGLLDLDDLLSVYLPASLIGEIPNASEATLRQLLNHTSGIPDYLTAKQFLNSLNEPYLIETQREKLKYAHNQEPTNSPGEEFSYSNTNFVLLGLVAEVIDEMPLWEVIDARIAQPLSLPNFAMGTELDPIPDDVARPYLALNGGKYSDIISFAVSDAATGDGGILTNMNELSGFFSGLFTGGLVNGASLTEMTSNIMDVPERQSDFDWPNEGYGLGLSRWNTPAGLAYGHTGSTGSYLSALFYFPDTGVMLSYVTTSVDNSDPDAFDEAFERLREELFEIATR
ncbi:MAG: serine hydrolase domain-containing protein [Saprospiraceae bacterium]